MAYTINTLIPQSNKITQPTIDSSDENAFIIFI